LAERNASLVSLGILTGKNCFFSGIAHTPTFLLAICLPALLQLLTWSRSLRLHHRFASLTENLSSFNGSYLRCSYTLSIFTGTRAAPRRAAEDKTAGEYRLAFAEGRLKKRKLPKRGIKIWVEPKAA
jgi:hypothetical protein